MHIFKLLLVTSPSPVPKKPDRAIHKFVCCFVSCLEYCPHSILFNHLEKILNIFGSFLLLLFFTKKKKTKQKGEIVCTLCRLFSARSVASSQHAVVTLVIKDYNKIPEAVGGKTMYVFDYLEETGK